MPLYEYESEGKGCPFCKDRFEVLQSINAASLSECPECGAPCHRVLSSFSMAKSTGDILSKKNLEAKGFTQYKKAGDGRYEKTLGKGPNVIKR